MAVIGVHPKSLAENYVKESINFLSLFFYPLSDMVDNKFRRKMEGIDDRMGEIHEQLLKFDKDDRVEFCKEIARLYQRVTKSSHRLLRPLMDVLSQYPPEELLSGEAYMKIFEAQVKRSEEVIGIQRELAQKIIDAFSETEIREALTESLKWRDVIELDAASKAAKKNKVKIKGHESCVFIEYDDEESGLSRTMRVG